MKSQNLCKDGSYTIDIFSSLNDSEMQKKKHITILVTLLPPKFQMGPRINQIQQNLSLTVTIWFTFYLFTVQTPLHINLP